MRMRKVVSEFVEEKQDKYWRNLSQKSTQTRKLKRDYYSNGPCLHNLLREFILKYEAKVKNIEKKNEETSRICYYICHENIKEKKVIIF